MAAATSSTKPRVLYWFRTDLRLHDSPALKAALDLDPEALYPIFCFDSHYAYHSRVGVNRWKFLLECQEDLSRSITRLNPKSKLFVLREPAVTLLPKLFASWRITHLVFEKDVDAYAKERDRKVAEIAQQAGVEVVTKPGRTLWDSDDLVRAFGGKPTMSMTQLLQAGAKLGEIDLPVPTPTSLPDPGTLSLDFTHTPPQPTQDLNAKSRMDKDQTYSAGIAGPRHDFSPPTLSELSLPEATTPHHGGESIALENLAKILADEEYTATFEKPKTSPAAFRPQSTCLTSPYLHFGALSCRFFYHQVEQIVQARKKAKQAVSSPPTSLTGQLLFRDMYFAVQAALGPKFGQTYDNAFCRFIPWHLPTKIDSSGLKLSSYEIDDAEKEVWFQRWAHGTTGFPWIDAIMRQLRQEGWIHHLARHSVACFLTRGGAYISWERGADVFEEFLIDHEPACNIGNWQWLSCSAFFHQFHRCYSPIAFGKKWDDNGTYIRKYVPELKDLPKKYIFEPHKAPVLDQKKAHVLVQGDGSETTHDGVAVYPKPMFDFNERRAICMRAMTTAYRVGLYGNAPEVLEGTWRSLFDDQDQGGAKGKPTDTSTKLDVEKYKKTAHSETPQAGRKRTRSRNQRTLDDLVQKKKKRAAGN